MPCNDEIANHQKLLAMYRGLLAEYLRQRENWDWRDVPAYLREGVKQLRHHILYTKGSLRGWGITLDDELNDEGPDDDIAGKIEHQRNLLRIRRKNLRHHLQQQTYYEPGQAPLIIMRSIEDERSNIQRVKAILRGWDVPVEDQPDD